MDEPYSTDEAKAGFSELLRIEDLAIRGIISERQASRPDIRPMADKPGALQRFLVERVG